MDCIAPQILLRVVAEYSITFHVDVFTSYSGFLQKPSKTRCQARCQAQRLSVGTLQARQCLTGGLSAEL